MMARPARYDDGVSETIGYALIIAIILTAVGITYLLGYPTLQHMIDSGHVQNMERGFIILGNNIDRVMEQSTPMQNTELSLEGGTVRNVQDGTFTVTTYYQNNTIMGNDSWEMYAIIYDFTGSSRKIGYEFGGTMEKYGPGNEIGGGTVLKDPRIVFGDPVIIPVVNIYGSVISKSGSGLAEVIMYGADTNLIKYDNVNYVDITVSGDFYLAWKDYFNGLQHDGVNINYISEDASKKCVTFRYGQPGGPLFSVEEVNKPITIEIE